jgi:hypothetical protein
MALLKYYDTTTSQWLPILAGAKGDTGETGATGATGPQGLPGTSTVSVTSPITNTGTTADATIGLDQALLQPAQNFVLNSSFDVWQRGAGTFSYGGTMYTADQWRAGRTSSATGGRVLRTTTSVPNGFYFAAQVQRASGDDKTNAIQFTQVFEDLGQRLRGKSITVSFFAMRGSNYTATGNALVFGINTSSLASSAVGYATGGLFISSNANAETRSSTAALTTTFTRYQATFTVPTTADAFQLFFTYQPTGGNDAGSNDWYRITGIQLEEGSVATAYKRNGSNPDAELSACQRYYVSSNGQIDLNYQTDTNGFGGSVFVGFPTQMRISPTVSTVFQSYDNAVNGGVASTVPSGFVSRSFRSSASWSYFRYGITYTASAEL